MGLKSDIFIDPLDENLKCPVCFDVFDAPRTYLCGHSFCTTCTHANQLRQCPTCRRSIMAGRPAVNYCLQGLINNLKVHCRNNIMEMPPRKRRRTRAATVSCCTWTGKLSDWLRHVQTECRLPSGVCPIQGCGFAGSPADLEEHNRVSAAKHGELASLPKVSSWSTLSVLECL
jgi:Zinc finger, C3HC4 type (RING finger)